MKKSIEIFIEGEHYLGMGLPVLAREKFLAALAINQANQDAEGIGVCLIYLVQIEITEKNKRNAQAYLDQAKVHYQHRNLEKMLGQLKLLQEAIDALDAQTETPGAEPAPSLPEATIDPFALFRNGEIEQATEIFIADVAEFRQTRNVRKLALSLLYLGQCRFTLGQMTEARAALNEARQLAQQLQDMEILHGIAQVFENMNLIDQQKDLDRLSIAEITSQKLPVLRRFMLLLSKAEILILKGLGKDAELAIHEARKLLPPESFEKQLVLIMIVESKLLRLKGKTGAAKSLLQQTRALAQKSGEPELVQLVEKSDFHA